MKAYRVKEPSGGFADGVWEHAANIPEIWRDCFEVRSFVEDGEVVEVDISREQFDEIQRGLGMEGR